MACLWGLSAWLAGVPGLGAAELQLKAVEPKHVTIKLYEHCELTIRIEGAAKNPYDPDEINVEAAFKPPRGETVTVPAFYYQPYDRVLEEGRESFKLAGDPGWKVRFTPRQVGTWSYEVHLTAAKGKQSLFGGNVEVVRSANRGFIEVDPSGSFFRFETGPTFIPIGENVCWGPSVQPLLSYNEWFRELARQRANYVRLWMAPWGFRLETKDTGVGRYDQLRAWQVDYLLSQSEKLGLHWQLALLDHGSFSQTHDPDWQNNPYNEQLGGMCRIPNDFVVDPRARRKFQQVLRYMVSRWGYSPKLVSWELFNEIDLSDIQLKDIPAWVSEMSAYLKKIDVNCRPVTISFHKAANGEPVWRMPTIDTIQLHLYDERDFAELFCGPLFQEMRQKFKKPVMVGEFGWIQDFVRQVDRFGIHIHDGLWSSLMGGAAASALTWYWDVYIHPNHLEREFRPLVAFWRGEQWSPHMKRLSLAFSTPDMLGCGNGSSERAYLWIKNRTHNVDQFLAYQSEQAKQREQEERGESIEALNYPPKVIRGATVAIGGLDRSGRYRLEWGDPHHGRVLASSVAEIHGGKLTLDVPELKTDLAAKLIKLHWWEQS